MRQLIGVMGDHGIQYSEQVLSAYGPQTVPSLPTDLLSYAQTLTWHSKSQDPTGLIWMGARYYDPKGGRFISPDPVSYPVNMDLYVYAGGDPVNYFDPDGRFNSPVYRPVGVSFISNFNKPIGVTYYHLYKPTTLFPESPSNPAATDLFDSLETNQQITRIKKVPVTYYGNPPGARTPDGSKSLGGHGWMGGIDINGNKFTQGSWPEQGGRMKYDEDQRSLCNETVSITLWVTPEQQMLARKAGDYSKWKLNSDNCIDHIVKSLDAIGYAHPSFKPCSVGTCYSDPIIYCNWLLEESKHIHPNFLPETEEINQKTH
jgi:RHS repeat-associated protein